MLTNNPTQIHNTKTHPKCIVDTLRETIIKKSLIHTTIINIAVVTGTTRITEAEIVIIDTTVVVVIVTAAIEGQITM